MQFMKLRGSDGGGSVRLVLGSTVSCFMDATISAVMVVRLRCRVAQSGPVMSCVNGPAPAAKASANETECVDAAP